MNFETMGFEGAILNALKNKNYSTPTPIQKQAIPLIQTGQDLLGLAQTGTGKTAAFALPIIDKILKMKLEPVRRGTYALILAPTRELVAQISDSFAQYSQGTGLRIVRILGGASHKSQVANMLKGSHILIATPGRLIDHIDNNSLRLKDCHTWVLDEVDQMLDLGFISPIRHISKKLPQDRQNLFFSATYPKEIARFAEELLTNPNRVEVAPQSTTAERVEQEIIQIESSKKRALMSDILANPELSKVMIFTKTRHGADKLARHLTHISVKNAVIHGDKRQNARMKSLDDFKSGKVRAIVATDVAARGIDIKNVTHVINYDMPTTPEAYVHRIGRTARAEASGKSISICTQEESNLLRQIERLIGQSIPKTDRRHDQSILQDKLLPVPAPIAHEKDPDRAQKNGRKERFEDGEKSPKSGKKRAFRPQDYKEDYSIGSEMENAIANLIEEPKPSGKSKKPFRNDAPRPAPLRRGRHSDKFENRDSSRNESRRTDDARTEKRPFNRPRNEPEKFFQSSSEPRNYDSRPKGERSERSERPNSDRSFAKRGDSRNSERRPSSRPFEKRNSARPGEKRENGFAGERKFASRSEGRNSDRPRSEGRSFDRNREGRNSDRPRSSEGRGFDRQRTDNQYAEAPRREGPKGDFKIMRRTKK